jgi:hypothetical protein
MKPRGQDIPILLDLAHGIGLLCFEVDPDRLFAAGQRDRDGAEGHRVQLKLYRTDGRRVDNALCRITRLRCRRRRFRVQRFPECLLDTVGDLQTDVASHRFVNCGASRRNRSALLERTRR